MGDFFKLLQHFVRSHLQGEGEKNVLEADDFSDCDTNSQTKVFKRRTLTETFFCYGTETLEFFIT